MTDSPTPAQIKAARKARNLTQTEAASVIDYSLSSWQYFEAPVGSKGHRKMKPALWRTWLREAPPPVDVKTKQKGIVWTREN